MAATVGDRDAVAAALDRDEAYDTDPQGDPPITVARYRRALRAVLAVEARTADSTHNAAGPAVDAYAHGQRDVLTVLVRDVAVALGAGNEG